MCKHGNPFVLCASVPASGLRPSSRQANLAQLLEDGISCVPVVDEACTLRLTYSQVSAVVRHLLC